MGGDEDGGMRMGGGGGRKLESPSSPIDCAAVENRLLSCPLLQLLLFSSFFSKKSVGKKVKKYFCSVFFTMANLHNLLTVLPQK